MSIAQMIATHPDVAGSLNEPLALAAGHAMFCSAICGVVMSNVGPPESPKQVPPLACENFTAMSRYP